ncbi:hypothetical protein EDC01DRAFT_644528 [Geopyxis carbonaria]|nr:hypothetical protein EDC01DRAFT_644528 [Geopyxis carbonaria]
MGWFWNSTPTAGTPPADTPPTDTKPAAKEKDHFSHLSPAVRSLLESEAPIKPSTAATRGLPPTPPAAPTIAHGTLPTPDSPHPPAQPSFDPTSYSAYGTKYADLWAQYVPQSHIEAAARTPQQAVADVYHSYKDRKAAVGRAALENCVFENEALHRCYGKTLLGLTGCAEEGKRLDRCFRGQQDFLKALGYMGVPGRSEEEEEKVQMRADAMWQEQVRREEGIEEEAKKRLEEKTGPQRGKETVTEAVKAEIAKE